MQADDSKNMGKDVGQDVGKGIGKGAHKGASNFAGNAMGKHTSKGMGNEVSRGMGKDMCKGASKGGKDDSDKGGKGGTDGRSDGVNSKRKHEDANDMLFDNKTIDDEILAHQQKTREGHVMTWEWCDYELKKVAGYVDEDETVEMMNGVGWISWKGVDLKFFSKNGETYAHGDRVGFHVTRDKKRAGQWLAIDVYRL